MQLRVFPRRTRATPNDPGVYVDRESVQFGDGEPAEVGIVGRGGFAGGSHLPAVLRGATAGGVRGWWGGVRLDVVTAITTAMEGYQ